MKKKINVNLTLVHGTYEQDNQYVLCGHAVEKILKVSNQFLPAQINVVAALKPFEKSKCIWIKQNDMWLQSHGASWTWTKKQTHNDICGGFLNKAQELLMTIISKSRRSKISPDNPLAVYYKITPVK
jgi:hypothetical protein